MGDRQAPSGSQENLPGHRGDPDGRDSALRVGGNTYYIGQIENANFGTNHGEIISCTIVNGSGSHEPVDDRLDAILSPITDASYTRNRKISPPDSDCFPGTREGVIQGITDWADSSVLFKPDTPHVFWTHGYVGCGKSSISQAVSQKYGGKGRLLGSFFFYRNSGDRSKMVRFPVTLASQMMAAVPATKSFYKAAVKADPTLLTRGASLSTQMERLVYKPFNAAVKRGLIFKTLVHGPFLVVVDGLDECEDKEEVKEFIISLLDFFKRHPSTPLRFFITSRVEQHIKECLNTAGVQLDDLVAHGSEDDILTFLETSFGHRVETDPVLAAYVKSNGQWPPCANLKTLVRHIGGSFIFASALFKYIVEPSDDGLNPITRLPLTLDMNPGLDGLYAFTVARSQRLPHFSDVIYTIALVFEPLSIMAIAELLGIETFEVLDVLVNLQAIIHIPGTDELPVTFCHTSFRDFLTTESRSGPFFISPSYHLKISYCCSGIVFRERQPNIETPSFLVTTYSRKHWLEHLNKFLQGTSEERILEAFEQLPHLPEQTFPVHLLSFTYILYWLFADHGYPRPKEAFRAVTRCIEFLALALECDPRPDRWLSEAFSRLGLPGPWWAALFNPEAGCYFEIRQEQATALQHIVERVETVIRAKYPSILSTSQPYPNIEFGLIEDMFFGDHTPISVYRVFEWMNRRVQAEIALDEPGTSALYYFELNFSREDSEWETRVTLHKRRVRSTNSRPEVGENGGFQVPGAGIQLRDPKKS